MSKLFGTDGIRGKAYSPPLDQTTISRVGHALTSHLSKDTPRILIGKDTRASGTDIETWLTTGIVEAGGSPSSIGITPTPAVSFLTKQKNFDAGVVISASHNKFQDNGIKLFSSQGLKFSEELEAKIEKTITEKIFTPSSQISPVPSKVNLESLYVEHLLESLKGVSLPKFKIALDCANGAAYKVGPEILNSQKLDLLTLFNKPDGENINLNCGSTSMETLRKVVTDNYCDLGAALDGDGDRVLLVDGNGRYIDGDTLLLIFGRHLKKQGQLQSGGVVATVMSNMALEVALAQHGVSLYRTEVGDRHVAQEMQERSVSLGGEQSGHIIFSDFTPTGDGLLTLLQLLRIMAEENKSLTELADMESYPQILVNVEVHSKPDIYSIPEIEKSIAVAKNKLGERGRMLIRYSGTESLLRIMLEGPNKAEISDLAEDISRAVDRSIGISNISA